jgi:hypothetical protein
MVIYNGYCRPLKQKVDFEVEEVNSIETSRGIKWQIKGNYDTHKISVFAKESVARELNDKLQKPDFFEAHTDTITREPKIHEIPLSQELDKPMMAFDAEEIIIYDSEELSPYPFFDAEAFASYDLPEEEETDFNILKSLRELEKEMLVGMIGSENDDQVGGKDSPVYIDREDEEVAKVSNIFFDDEFDSIIIAADGEFERQNDDDFNVKEFSEGCITVEEFYNKFNQLFKQIDVSDVSSIKLKVAGKTYDYFSAGFSFSWDDGEDGGEYLHGLYFYLTNYAGGEGENYSRFNFCDVINYGNIKTTFDTHGDVPVYLMLIDTDDCDNMSEATRSFIDGEEPDFEIEMITGFKSQFDEDQDSFSLSNLKTKEGVKKSDIEKPFFTLKELYENMTNLIDEFDIDGDLKDDVNMQLVGIYSNGEFGDYDDDVYGVGFGGQFIEGSLYIGVEKQEAIEALEEEQDYSELKVVELKELLADRGLPVSGRKAELIERLEEDDESSGGELIEQEDVLDEGSAMSYDELNEFVDDRIEDGEGDEPAFFTTQFTDLDGDVGTTATVIVNDDEDDTDFIGTAIPEIPLEESYDDWEDDDDDDEWEAQEHVIDVDEDEDSVSITYTKEAEQSPFTTNIGFITFHSPDTNQEVGEDDEDVIPMIFDQFIPPEIWGDLKDSQQKEFIKTGDESILICSKCGMTKADMRASNGYCPTVDPMHESYVAKRDCPYSKHFAPMHWIGKEESPIIEATKVAMNNVYFDDNTKITAVAAEEVMAAEEVFYAPNRDSKPVDDAVSSMVVSKAEYYDAIHSIPPTVSAVETNDGTMMKLGYFNSESHIIESLFADTLMAEEIIPPSFSAESQTLPELWAEDLNNFIPPTRDSITMSAEDYEADEGAQMVDKYDYFRNIMHLGDETEVVDMGDKVVVIDKDVIEPNLEVNINECVGCSSIFKKSYQLDKQGMCIDCSEDSINLSQLQRYKEGGIATYDESDEPMGDIYSDDEEIDDYIDSDEFTEDGYEMFEEDYEEWTDDYESESTYVGSKYANNNKWLIGALSIGSLAVLFAPEKVRELFKRK